jgi:magnesium and cobalt exporter, CNNM family
VKVRDTQLQTLEEKGHRRAVIARQIVGNLDAALSATQLGITIASLGWGWLGKPVFASLLAPALGYLRVGPDETEWIAFAIGFTVITILHIVAGDLARKSLAIQKPLATALWVAPPLQCFNKLFYPGHLAFESRGVLAIAAVRPRSSFGNPIGA